MDSSNDPTQKVKSSSLFLTFLPIPLFIVTIAILHLVSPTHPGNRFVFEPPLLLPILNTVFLFIVGCIISYIALRAYLLAGSFTTLLLGCGVLTLGMGALLAGWLIGPGGPNVTATVFNTTALIASLFHVIAAIVDFSGKQPGTDRGRRQVNLILGYGSVAIFVIVLAILSDVGITPPFFIQGKGPTPLRQVVLATAFIFYVIASSYMMKRFIQKRVTFFFWYSLALVLVAINMAGTYLQPAVGSVLGWVSRFAVYVAGIYFLTAVTSTSREAGKQKMSLDESVAELFRKSEQKISSILASITDCHFELDREWRFVRVNDHAVAYFGRKRDELIGRSYFEVFPPLKYSTLHEHYMKAISESTSTHFDVASVLYPGKWIELHVYPTEEKGVSVFFRDVTEHKRAAEKLAASEALLRAVLDGSPDPIFMKDREGRLLLANQATFTVIGKPVEACLGKTDDQFYDNLEDGRAIMANDRRIMASGKIEIVEETVNAPSGPRHYLTTKAPYRDAVGAIVGLIGVARDITEHKRAEEEVRESEERFRMLSEMSPVGVGVSSTDGVLLYANRAYESILGYNRGELLGKKASDLYLNPDDRVSWLGAMKEEHAVRDVELCLARKDGTPVWVTINTSYLDYEGRQAVMGTIQDITERKRIEDELRKSRDELENRVKERTAEVERERKRLYDVLEALPAMVCLLTPDYHVAFANRSFREKFGESEGRHCYDFCFGNKQPCDFCQSYNVLKTGRPHHWEVTSPDGNTIIDAFDFPFTDIDGSPLILEMDIDITDRRRAEAELQQAYQNLLAETEERKRLEDQLRQSQKMEAIGTLAGGIAHDFNNILAAIIGFAEMVEEDLPPESPSLPRIGRVISAANRGKELVQQILTFSRKAEPTRMPITLAPIIEEAVQFLRASLPSTIDISLSMKAANDTIVASPIEIQQILMNLATNAAFAMREKGGTLGIHATNIGLDPGLSALGEDVEQGEYVQIVVTDTGIGMTQEVMKRVFDPFFTTKELGKGTGMGLAVVYGIVKSLGGTIVTESEPGTGSTFRIFLPLAPTDKKTEEYKEQIIPKGKERILFVDDEELLVEWGQAALERLGYTVTALTDSTQAFNLFSSDPSAFDLIILDQTMPGLTGLNLSKKLLAVRANIPIILCTGHSDSVTPEKAREAGIKEFILKPLGKQHLAGVIRRVLNTTDYTV